MKKIFKVLIFIISISLIIAACSSSDNEENNNPPLVSDPNNDNKITIPDNKNFEADKIIYGIRDNILGYPVGVTIKDEDVYIIDIYSINGVVKHFDERGRFINKFGGMELGFELPSDLAICNNNLFYISDIEARAIWVLNEKGELVNKIHYDDDEEIFLPRKIEINSKGNLIVLSFDQIWEIKSNGDIVAKYAESGRDEGQLGAEGSEFYIGPSGLALDEEDNIYVADTINNRIQIFDSDGNYVRMITNDDVGGIFTYIIDVSLDSDSNIYFTDMNSYYIVRLNFQGEFLDRIGGMGRQRGNFGDIAGNKYGILGPTSISVCNNDNLFAVDSFNHRVQAFNENGNVVTSFGNDDLEGAFIFPNDVVIDRDKNIYIVSGEPFIEDPLNYKAIKFNREGELEFELVSGYNIGQFVNPASITVDSRNNVYILDLDMVQRFSSGGLFHSGFGGRGNEQGDFGVVDYFTIEYGPSAIVSDNNGNLFVADKFNNRIQKFSISGEFIDEFSVPQPENIAIYNNIFYVLNSNYGFVYKLDQYGETLNVFGEEDQHFDGLSSTYESGEKLGPKGIAVDNSGNVYVADTYKSRIVVFSPDGQYLTSLGIEGQGNNEFLEPKGIIIHNNNLYVADSGNHRIMRFPLINE